MTHQKSLINSVISFDTHEEFLEFLDAERKAIDVAKWIEGERRQQDPGNDYKHYWIEQHAEAFRIAWIQSVCRNCKNKHCRYQNKPSCNNFL